MLRHIEQSESITTKMDPMWIAAIIVVIVVVVFYFYKKSEKFGLWSRDTFVAQYGVTRD